MEGLLIQPWTTLRLMGATAVAYQAEEDWLDVDPYLDLIVWIEASQVLLGGGTQVRLDLETSPTKDEALFLSMCSTALAVDATGPTIVKILQGEAAVLPQAWMRWKLSPLGSPSGEWGATFRVHCAANRRRAV